MRVIETGLGYEEITEEEWWDGWYDHNDDRTEEEGEDY